MVFWVLGFGFRVLGFGVLGFRDEGFLRMLKASGDCTSPSAKKGSGFRGQANLEALIVRIGFWGIVL